MRCFGGRHSIACCATTRLKSTCVLVAIAYRRRRGTGEEAYGEEAYVEEAYVPDRT